MAKTLRILIFLVVFANVGLIALALSRPRAAIWAPLVVGLAFTSLPAYVAIPRPDYLCAFISAATVTGLVGIDAWLEMRAAMRESAET